MYREYGLTDCVSVNIRRAEDAIRTLKGLGLMADGKPIRRGDELHLPVTAGEASLNALRAAAIEASPCAEEFKATGHLSLSKVVPGLSGFLKLGSVVILNYNGHVDISGYVKAVEALKGMYRDLSSVFLKLGTTGELRLPELVLIYGDGNTLTKVRENGLEFFVDVKRTYFNPRLSGERARIASMVGDGELVLDMFSGVGPFAITVASKASAEVLSVDLNPYASHLAALNAITNRKRLKGSVTVLRADSRRLPEVLESRFDRIIMNNPTQLLEFVDTACSLSHRGTFVHAYILSRSEGEALGEVAKAFRSSCEGVKIIGHRKALEHSPSKSIFVIDLVLEG